MKPFPHSRVVRDAGADYACRSLARVARGRHAGDYSLGHRSCGHLIPRERRSSEHPRFSWHWTLRPSGADPGTSMKAWSHVHGFARSLG